MAGSEEALGLCYISPFICLFILPGGPLSSITCHCKKKKKEGGLQGGPFNNNVSSVPCGNGRRENEGYRGRPAKEDLQTCASKHYGWRISHTVLVEQCDKHQLLLFILLAVMQPFQYYRLSSLDSVLMCCKFYLIYYSFFWSTCGIWT